MSSESGDEVEAVKAVEEEEEDTTLANSDVTTKYQEAAKIANAVLEAVIAKVSPGSTPVELCQLGDRLIDEKVSKIFNKKISDHEKISWLIKQSKGCFAVIWESFDGYDTVCLGQVKGRPIEKGVAFPTCVSVNEYVCHNSPLLSEPQAPLAEGDLVKVDLGVHIDGYCAVVAHTVAVGAQPSPEAPWTEKKADVFMAAITAAEVATKLIKPGNTNQQVTQAIAKVASSFEVNALQGILMHQMKRYVVDGNKVIILREDVDQKVDDFTFELYETYSVDIAFSSGEGKPRETDIRTTVFKRAVDKTYQLKIRASRYVLNEVNQRFPTLPFSLRALEDERQARMGVKECITHELLHQYPVLTERPGDIVAHIKLTVLLLPTGTVKVTGISYNLDTIKSDKTVDEETAKILATSSKKKKKKNKKKGDGKEDDA